MDLKQKYYKATITKTVDQNLKKAKTYSSYKADAIGEQIHADLMFLKDDTIVLIMVDVYSRYLRMNIIPNKRADTVNKHVEDFVHFLDHDNSMIITDDGREFTRVKNRVVSKSFYGSGFIESHIGRVKKVLLKLSLIEPQVDYKELIPIAEEILNERYMTVTGCSPDDAIDEKCIPRKHKCVNDKFVHPIHSFCLIPNQDKKLAKGKLGEKLSTMTNYDTRIYIITKKTFYNCRYRYTVAPFKIVMDGDEEIERWELLNKFYYEELYIIQPNELKKFRDAFDEHHKNKPIDIEDE